MEDGIKKLAKAHQKTEKLQERQAASLDLLVKLQTQAYADPLLRHPRSLATLTSCHTNYALCSVTDFSSRKALRLPQNRQRHHRA